jgi:hypothetical protein
MFPSYVAVEGSRGDKGEAACTALHSLRDQSTRQIFLSSASALLGQTGYNVLMNTEFPCFVRACFVCVCVCCRCATAGGYKPYRLPTFFRSPHPVEHHVLSL